MFCLHIASLKKNVKMKLFMYRGARAVCVLWLCVCCVYVCAVSEGAECVQNWGGLNAYKCEGGTVCTGVGGLPVGLWNGQWVYLVGWPVGWPWEILMVRPGGRGRPKTV